MYRSRTARSPAESYAIPREVSTDLVNESQNCRSQHARQSTQAASMAPEWDRAGRCRWGYRVVGQGVTGLEEPDLVIEGQMLQNHRADSLGRPSLSTTARAGRTGGWARGGGKGLCIPPGVTRERLLRRIQNQPAGHSHPTSCHHAP